MRFIPITILAASLCLTSCKADQTSHQASQIGDQTGDRTLKTANSPTAAPAPEADNRPLVVCFGDSLTAGYGADTGQAYPDYLQKDLDAKGYKYRVVNEGVSGNTTKDGIERLPSIVATKPAVVIVEFGGNDGLRGLKIDTTRTNLAQIVQTLQSAGIKVVLAGISLPPDYGPDYVNTFTAMYPTLAKQFKTPLLPFLLKDVYGVPGMMQADKTHATNQGNEIVAKNLLPVLLPELKK